MSWNIQSKFSLQYDGLTHTKQSLPYQLPILLIFDNKWKWIVHIILPITLNKYFCVNISWTFQCTHAWQIKTHTHTLSVYERKLTDTDDDDDDDVFFSCIYIFNFSFNFLFLKQNEIKIFFFCSAKLLSTLFCVVQFQMWNTSEIVTKTKHAEFCAQKKGKFIHW